MSGELDGDWSGKLALDSFDVCTVNDFASEPVAIASFFLSSFFPTCADGLLKQVQQDPFCLSSMFVSSSIATFCAAASRFSKLLDMGTELEDELTPFGAEEICKCQVSCD